MSKEQAKQQQPQKTQPQEEKKNSPEAPAKPNGPSAGKIFGLNFLRGAGWQLGVLTASIAVGTAIALLTKSDKTKK